MARPKQAAKQEAIPSVWDDLGIPGPTREPVRQQTRYASGERDDQHQTAILDRLERLERDRSFDSYRTPASASQQYQLDPKTVRFDPTGLPDPIDNKDAYNKALADRVNAALDARDHAVRQELSGQTDRVQAANKLWDQMVGAHPEWRDHKSLIGSVAAEVVEELKGRGIDTSRFVFQEAEKFSEIVAERLSQRGYDKVFVSEEGDEKGEKTEAKPAQKWRGGLSEEEENRTEGIMGGMESGGLPSKGKAEAPSDMISDMKAIQERLFNRPL